jgi:cell division protein FtsZ
VNITAGLDLTLGEFSEVGDTIEEFASDDATVVVGTVIDPDLSEELKVTVVATGLGSEAVRAPLQVVEPAPRVSAPEVAAEQVAGVEEPDYRDLDLPPSTRRARAASAMAAAQSPASGGEEYFDIPAFLRRQAD